MEKNILKGKKYYIPLALNIVAKRSIKKPICIIHTINFSLNFQITTYKNYNNNEIRLNCIAELIEYFNIDKWQINQPIIISEISNLLASIEGVQTVEKIELENKNGVSLGYSQYKYDFTRATKNGVVYPSMEPSIFEIKYPTQDINGLVTTY